MRRRGGAWLSADTAPPLTCTPVTSTYTLCQECARHRRVCIGSHPCIELCIERGAHLCIERPRHQEPKRGSAKKSWAQHYSTRRLPLLWDYCEAVRERHVTRWFGSETRCAPTSHQGCGPQPLDPVHIKSIRPTTRPGSGRTSDPPPDWGLVKGNDFVQ